MKTPIKLNRKRKGSGYINQNIFLQSDKTPASIRLKINNNAVEDRKTGLAWYNGNLFELPLDWNEAIECISTFKSNENQPIQWRLPSRDELFSLISHQDINPTIAEGHPFKNVFNGYYWTRTECSRLPGQAWYIHLGGGRVQLGMKHGSYLVLPVSGPELKRSFSKNRFKKQLDCIFDRFTNRTWLQHIKINRYTCSWKDALNIIDRINASRTAGFSDWRLPNIRELDSLVDTSLHSPAFAAGFSLGSVKDGYWSSTTSKYEPRYAWVLYTQDGAIGVGYKPSAYFGILPVR